MYGASGMVYMSDSFLTKTFLSFLLPVQVCRAAAGEAEASTEACEQSTKLDFVAWGKKVIYL